MRTGIPRPPTFRTLQLDQRSQRILSLDTAKADCACVCKFFSSLLLWNVLKKPSDFGPPAVKKIIVSKFRAIANYYLLLPTRLYSRL